MSELRFQDKRLNFIFGDGDVSPDDSVFFPADPNFSLFSSASAAVDRCSESHKQDSQHLAGHKFPEALGAPSPDQNKVIVQKNSFLGRKEKGKECRDRRSISGSLLKISDRKKCSSFDRNNVIINAMHSSSPHTGIVKKPTVTSYGAGTFPSPGTPNYRHTIGGIQKGWSLERVPLHSTANRRQLTTSLLPNNNGRALPSKWEVAERWIFSSVSGHSSVGSSFQQPQMRPKSKSGPLGHPGLAYYSLYSPVGPVFKGGNGGNTLANSPFSTGVMTADSVSFPHGGTLGGGNIPACTDPCIARSASIHGCSELISLSTQSIPQDESSDVTGGAADRVTRAISRRNMATQMSPKESPPSPLGPSSLSPSTTFGLPIEEFQSVISSKAQVQDVPVHEQVAVTTRSKEHKAWILGKGMGIEDWKKKAGEIHSSHLEVSDIMSASKTRRQESRITAWENLQKAKAEAALTKLEMKLEKKRSSSMDKIMNKLKSAQRKAQEIRTSLSANQATEVAKSSHKVLPFHRTHQLSSLSGCFTCHAF